MSGWKAFLSYVRQDDNDEGGRISQLAGLLSARVRLLTGEGFPIFLDRESIGWGDDWEAKINEALISTTFFVPVITPSYFRSESCRKELLRFTSSATALGLEDLILPIYYVTVPEFDLPTSSGDDLIDVIRRYQWIDWRETALEAPNSSVHRKQIDMIAKQFLKRAVAADAKPTPELTASGLTKRAESVASHDIASDKDEEPGVLEILAEGELALPRLNELLGQYIPVLQALTSAAEEATERLRRSDEERKGFAGRLTVGKWFAEKLSDPATTLESLTPRFFEELLKVDPMVLMFFELVKTNENKDEWLGILSFVDSIDQMADSAESGLGSIADLARIIGENANWSKDVRKSARRIERALRQVADARSVFRQWKTQAAELRSTHSSRPDAS